MLLSSFCCVLSCMLQTRWVSDCLPGLLIKLNYYWCIRHSAQKCTWLQNSVLLGNLDSLLGGLDNFLGRFSSLGNNLGDLRLRCSLLNRVSNSMSSSLGNNLGGSHFSREFFSTSTLVYALLGILLKDKK